jgi:hypothetical protein
VISGIPGVGKTTLAQILVIQLIDAGFELIAVRDDVGEAFELLDLNKRQIVYYDDFLGRCSIGERLGKNEDRSILRLLEEASRSKTLKVILTTREYILNEAQRLYEPLSGTALDIAKCIVKVEDYTRGHRARILYNHVFFSDLPREYAVALARNHAYRAIVDHKNYSPRIVEWMTSDAVVRGIPAEGFVDAFVKALDDPLRIWEHAFAHQIGDEARMLLFCLAFMVEDLTLDALRTAWAAASQPGGPLTITREQRSLFNAALKHLDGSFVRTQRRHSETWISFHNPSIRDFVARRIAGDAELREDLLSGSQFFEQVSCLVRLDSNGHVQSGPAGLVCDSAPLREAVRRTFAAKSPILSLVPSRRGSHLKLVRRPTDLGSRLSIMAAWATVFGVNWLEFICEVGSEEADSGDVAKVATTEACSFVEAVIHQWPLCGGRWSDLVERFIGEIRDGIDIEASADDWAVWSNFLQRNADLFTEEILVLHR